MVPEEIVSHRPAHRVMVITDLKMVSEKDQIGLPLVGAIISVADLQHLVLDVRRVMVREIRGQVLLVHTRAGDVLSLNLSKARGDTSIQGLLDVLPGVDIRNLQILEGKTTPKTIVVVQPMTVLQVPPPLVCVMVEHIQVEIVEHTISGKAPPVSSVD